MEAQSLQKGPLGVLCRLLNIHSPICKSLLFQPSAISQGQGTALCSSLDPPLALSPQGITRSLSTSIPPPARPSR